MEIPGATQASYTITGFAEASHAGRYVVEAVNAVGNATSTGIMLIPRVTTIGGVDGDSFDDNETDTTKWVINDFADGGVLAEYNGTLRYTAPNGGSSVNRVWKAQAMPYDGSWAAKVGIPPELVRAGDITLNHGGSLNVDAAELPRVAPRG